MARIPVRVRVLALALLTVLAAGCGGGGGPLAAVHGRVLYRGYPLAGGKIVLTPDASRGSTGPLAGAETRGDGTYVLETDGLAGAAPGYYRITVMALETPAPGPYGQPAIPRSLLPAKYLDPELSGLSCQVEAGRDNEIDLNLE